MLLSRHSPLMLFVVIACLVSANPADAVVRYVDGRAAPGGDGLSWATAYDSLSPALAAAQPGDQIWVAAGRYVGNFGLVPGVEVYGGFSGTETELSQRDWTANPTILDGNQTGSVVMSPPRVAATSRIDGFTITNGSGLLLDTYKRGGGLYLDRSSPMIANNTITGNAADWGGGIYLLESSPTIGTNTITGNAARLGGGLYLDSSSPTILNNTITGNASGDGGGLYMDFSSPTIADNMITGNSADFWGGGLYLDSSFPTISNNTIAANSSRYCGGGLYLRFSSPTIAANMVTGNTSHNEGGGLSLESSSPLITSNTITGNSARTWGGGLKLHDSSPTIANNTIAGNSAGFWGGGLDLYESSPTLANNTIAGNSADRQGGGLYLEYSSPTIENTIVAFNSSGIYRKDIMDTPALGYNCVYGNTEYDYSGLTDPTGTDGNISADPLLADLSYGNVHIQPDSPCVDAGSNADAWGDFDVDGQPRIRPSGGTVDIGADESDGTLWAAGPYTFVRVSPAGDDANDGSSWTLAKRTVQAGINAAAATGGEVWVQAGIYYERIILPSYAYVYGGFSGGETARDERDWAVNVTTLDGQGQGSVVTARTGDRVSAIDGFTIRNGSAGGVYLWYSSPTIANNTITGNAGSYGGGLYMDFSSPTISNNTITGNSADRQGGGLYLRYSSPTIVNNTVTGNSADYGGGLYLDYSFPTIVNNTIAGNSASYGGEPSLFDSSHTIANTIVAFNSYGGGLYLQYSSPTIVNNTIAGNSASCGGGLSLFYSSPTIANTIVAFNSSGIYQADTTSTCALRYNCVYGNTEYDYSGLTDPTGTDGNISADPLLADLSYGNVHIQPGSPCADAGSNADAVGEFDMDGQPRVQPSGGTVEIGADESDGTVWAPGPYTVVRVSHAGDDANDGSSWTLAKRTVQAGIDGASALGGEVWVQTGTYQECITLQPYAYLYGGFAGGETARYERDWHANVTILDGQQQGSVVTGRAGYQVSAIDGFTITRGSGTGSPGYNLGGGILLLNSSATIANNTVVGNTAYDGGGLYLRYSSPTIVNNTVMGNSADYGGGLYLDYSSPTILNNTITGNASGNGGGLYLSSSSPTIANNTITGNSTRYSGGGMLLLESSPTIAHNTITGNSGDGLYLSYSSPAIENNTISRNTGSGLSLSYSSPAIQNNAIASNAGRGLHLRWSSPAIANNAITANSGGGLFLQDSRPTIANNTITGNSTRWGGGLDLYESSPTILNNTIAGNSASYGGGLYLYSSSPTVVGNMIALNSASDWGGGLCLHGSSPRVVNNVITGNTAGYGGGLGMDLSSPTVANNAVVGNSAVFGGGLYLTSSPAAIANNTVVGNNAILIGGGMYLAVGSPTLANTIIAFNSSGIYQSDGTPTLRSNCVYDNAAYNYSGLTDPTGTEGNISANPLFMRNPDDGGDGWGDNPDTPDVDEGANDDSGDLRLLSGSPCIDAGENARVPADTPDLDGDGDTTEPLPFDLSDWSRFVDDWLTIDTGLGTPPIVDMGAYEHPAPGDCDGNTSLDLADFSSLADCMTAPGSAAPGECDCAKMDSDGDLDLADFAEFQTRCSQP